MVRRSGRSLKGVYGMLRELVWLILALAIAGGLAGCRAEEQDRFKIYEPGVYQGKPDQALSQAQREALARRMSFQAGGSLGASGLDKAPSDVRPPG